MMKKKIAALLLGSALAVSTLTGCGKQDVTNEGESQTALQQQEEKKQETVTIEFFQQKSEVVDVYNNIIEKFQTEYPDIKVTQTCVPDASKVFMTRVSTNDIPDVIHIFPTQTTYKSMMEEGIFEDLTQEPVLNNVSEATVEQIKYKDRVYAVPLTVNAFALYYNKDIFEEHKITEPKTFEELIQVCETLKAAGVQPFVFMDKDTGAFGQQAERILGGNINQEIWTVTEKVAAGTTSFVDEPDIRLLAETLLKIREYGPKDSLGIGSDQANDDFANGRSAMILAGTWGLSSYLKLNPEMNVGVTAFPSIDGKETYTCGTVDAAIAISANSEKKEAAKLFVEYLTKPEIAQIYCDADKNPNLVKGVQYSVKELMPINDMINEGKFSLIPTSYWPAGYRDEWQVKLQELVLTKDVDAFLKATDEITEQYYNQ